jgi:hypothetical protein
MAVLLLRGSSAAASVVSSGTGGFQTLSTSTITSAYKIVDNETFSYTIFVSGADAANLYVRWVNVRYRLGTP